jgi:O-succinylbenzoate synthase
VLRAVELFRVRLPLVQPFRTATSATAVKDALLVHVITDAGEGWGECVAPRHPTYLPDTIDTSRLALRDHLVPRAFAGASLHDVRGHAPARFALECALLDAQLRAEGVSLARHLGATRPRVEAGVAIGLVDDDRELAALVAHYAEQGYGRMKLKIEPGHDTDVVKVARAAAGDAIELAVDANGSYATGDASDVRALDEFGLQCIEQPLAPDAIGAHARLASELYTPVCLDESITGANVAHDAIATGACDMVSIKAGRLGSFTETRAVHDLCVAGGVPALAGGMLETGVGRAALLAIAALPGCTATGDCSGSARYFGPDGDLTEPFVVEDGRLQVPDGPGLGTEVIADRLARVTIARERMSAKDE